MGSLAPPDVDVNFEVILMEVNITSVVDEIFHNYVCVFAIAANHHVMQSHLLMLSHDAGVNLYITLMLTNIVSTGF